MFDRPLPPAIGATENALRLLLARTLADSVIGGYEQWVYLNIQERIGTPALVEKAVIDALKQPAEVVVRLRSQLVRAGLLGTDGLLTDSGREQVKRCRGLVAEATQALVSASIRSL